MSYEVLHSTVLCGLQTRAEDETQTGRTVLREEFTVVNRRKRGCGSESPCSGGQHGRGDTRGHRAHESRSRQQWAEVLSRRTVRLGNSGGSVLSSRRQGLHVVGEEMPACVSFCTFLLVRVLLRYRAAWNLLWRWASLTSELWRSSCLRLLRAGVGVHCRAVSHSHFLLSCLRCIL